MNRNDTQPQTWPDLAIGLYDRLTERNAEITYEFNNVRVNVPAGTGSDDASARWTIDGSMTIHTRDRSA